MYRNTTRPLSALLFCLLAFAAGVRAQEGEPEGAPSWDLKFTISGHTETVYAAEFFPDGETLVTGSQDGSVRLWSTRTGKQTRALAEEGAGVSGVAVSPDARLVAACSDGDDEGIYVRVWDARTGRLVRRLGGHEGGVYDLAFSPDTRLLATAGKDGLVKLWNTQTWALLRTLKGHESSVTDTAFSPDGRVLVSSGASSDNSVRLWDTRTGRLLRTLKGHDDWVTTVAYAPDGATVASASRDKTIILWNARTGAKRRELPQEEMVYEVDFSPDGKVMAVCGASTMVRLLDASSGELLGSFGEHGDEIAEIKFSRQGTLLVSGGYDSVVKLWASKNPPAVVAPPATPRPPARRRPARPR